MDKKPVIIDVQAKMINEKMIKEKENETSLRPFKAFTCSI